ncbi:MAG: hypothetical protein R3C01_11940 [Planctomycetaceae bacterium]
MGALILLLLVTTRRIRQQAEMEKLPVEPPAAALVVVAPKVSDEHVQPSTLLPGVFELSNSELQSARNATSTPNWTTTSGPKRESHKIEQPPSMVPVYLAKKNQLDVEWNNKVRSLATQRAEQAARVAALERQLQQQKGELALLQQQQAEARVDTLQQQSDEVAIQQGLLAASESRQQLSAAIQETERLLREVLAKRQEDSSRRTTILPVDPITGTTRRPIVIDCLSDRLVLVAEGIAVSARDLNGFTPLYNPLAAGVLALARERRSNKEAEAEPYVLMIVRPEGMISYYVARLMLQSHQVPFGYELVDTNEEFVWERSSENEIAVCQTAIDEAIRLRPQGDGPVVSALGVSRPVHVTGTEGEFHLSEVDDLRSPGRTVSVAGQRFRRDSFSSDTSSTLPENDRRSLAPSGRYGPPLAPSTDSSGSGTGYASRQSETGNPPTTGTSHGDNETDSGKYASTHRPRHWDPRTEPFAGETRRADADRSNSGKGDASRNLDRPFGRPSSAPTTDPPSFGESGGSSGPTRGPSGSPANGLSRSQQNRGQQGGEPGEQRWGDFEPGSSIGIKKDLVIRIEPSRLIVGEQPPISMQDVNALDLQAILADRLQEHVSTWGRPPSGFYWLPRAEFIVSPGGARDYESAAALMKKLGIDSSVKYVLE